MEDALPKNILSLTFENKVENEEQRPRSFYRLTLDKRFA